MGPTEHDLPELDSALTDGDFASVSSSADEGSSVVSPSATDAASVEHIDDAEHHMATETMHAGSAAAAAMEHDLSEPAPVLADRGRASIWGRTASSSSAVGNKATAEQDKDSEQRVTIERPQSRHVSFSVTRAPDVAAVAAAAAAARPLRSRSSAAALPPHKPDMDWSVNANPPSRAASFIAAVGGVALGAVDTVREAAAEIQATATRATSDAAERARPLNGRDPRDQWRGRGAVFETVWWLLYAANMAAAVTAVMLQDSRPSVYWLVPLFALVAMTNVLVTDIATEAACITIALCCRSTHVAKVSCEPMTPGSTNKFLIVYCLKSNQLTDIKETLMFMQASWRLNQEYSKATYCILSGTQDANLAAHEQSEVAAWNARNAEEGGRCRYVRRTRTILFKYGQYLDFIMLLNGYKQPMLYKDVKSNHPSGLCFDPATDLDYFCGSDFEFLAIMDRDNMLRPDFFYTANNLLSPSFFHPANYFFAALSADFFYTANNFVAALSPDFFHTANNFFAAYPELEILQPAVTPFPKCFRRAINGGESYYTSLAAKYQSYYTSLAAKYQSYYTSLAAKYQSYYTSLAAKYQSYYTSLAAKYQSYYTSLAAKYQSYYTSLAAKYQCFRRASNGGESYYTSLAAKYQSYYTSLAAKYQVLGIELAEHKRVFIPSAAFYGKGIIRRSSYNKTLLGWNPATGRTREEQRIPRDLISHDIIESSVMKTLLAPEISIFEDLPLTHVEWHLRQIRWDLGDIIISKYLYPFTYGLLPNLFTWFSYGQACAFYAAYFDKMASAVYSSTFNIRCIYLKPAVLAVMAALLFLHQQPIGMYGLAAFVNVQIVLVPFIVSMAVVRRLTWKEKLLLQIHTIYMGVVDIYYGSWRCGRAMVKMATDMPRWRTFQSLSTTPCLTLATVFQLMRLELLVASAATAALLYFNWGDLSTAQYITLGYLSVVVTFPLYAFATSRKTGAAAVDDLKYGGHGMITALAEIAKCMAENDDRKEDGGGSDGRRRRLRRRRAAAAAAAAQPPPSAAVSAAAGAPSAGPSADSHGRALAALREDASDPSVGDAEAKAADSPERRGAAAAAADAAAAAARPAAAFSKRAARVAPA
ncbi:hypothetical protein JKP88DRAFT_281595 [Tribonema minus]|uniref:Uncharacterized protein n=1 Tax=Tribonema minus TaxID=303371 RepID=A0A835YQ19_9STRA|nr:hypothetical protein JKP88DRAFT_281595 [Tribonema minus]